MRGPEQTPLATSDPLVSVLLKGYSSLEALDRTGHVPSDARNPREQGGMQGLDDYSVQRGARVTGH